MILDSLSHWSQYAPLHPLLSVAFEFISSADLASLAPGKYVLIEDKLIVMLNEVQGKTFDKARMEVHNDFWDIHIPLSGTERFAWQQRDVLKEPAESFNVEKDAQHYSDAPATYLDVEPGCFLICFPSDAHAGCIAEGKMKKIVIKLRRE